MDGLHLQEFYSGAYESPLEERLAWNLSKLLKPGTRLLPQVEVSTRLGRFRPDLTLISPEGVSVLECDGRAYHGDAHRDHVRDLALLETGVAGQGLRFAGDDLYGSLNDLIRLVCVLHPGAFDHRGETITRRLASPEVRALDAGELRLRTHHDLWGTQPGRRERAFGLRRFALDTPDDALRDRLLPGLQAGRFRNLADAVEQTRSGKPERPD